MADKKKILIVEDDQFIREMYGLLLRKQGYEVMETPDGAAGLTEAQQGGFDLILLDLMMPIMDGLTFLKKIKEHPAHKKNGPIIVMSNLAYDEAAQETADLGAVDFFVKADLDPKQIVEIVRKHLSNG